jgi:hypothetical protein
MCMPEGTPESDHPGRQPAVRACGRPAKGRASLPHPHSLTLDHSGGAVGGGEQKAARRALAVNSGGLGATCGLQGDPLASKGQVGVAGAAVGACSGGAGVGGGWWVVGSRGRRRRRPPQRVPARRAPGGASRHVSFPGITWQDVHGGSGGSCVDGGLDGALLKEPATGAAPAGPARYKDAPCIVEGGKQQSIECQKARTSWGLHG